MKLKPIITSVSIYAMLFALTLIIPIAVAIYYQESFDTFYKLMLGIFLVATPLYYSGKQTTNELNRIDGFLLIIFTWLILCAIAAIPFLVTLDNASYVDSWFEAVSGLTTTGAEVFQIDQWPNSLKIYHQFLQFLGGLGIIVLGIAIMPLLGNNASTLLDTEHSVQKEQRITPRISKAAKQLWKLYLTMVILSAFCYKFAGLTWFDAWSYSFTTFSTGGFGIYSDSIMHYNSNLVSVVACIFALLGSLNFTIIFTAIRQKQIMTALKFPETKMLAKYIVFISFIVVINSIRLSNQTSILNSVGSVIMMITTTGLQVANISQWPSFLSHLVLTIAVIGGSSCSTTGGIKMARIISIQKEISALFKQLLHPRAISSNLKTNSLIHGFIALNIIVYLISILLMLDMGYSLESAFAGVTACLTNVGMSIGKLSNGYQNLSNAAKWLLSFLMLIGRLEATTILIVLSPFFWQEI